MQIKAIFRCCLREYEFEMATRKLIVTTIEDGGCAGRSLLARYRRRTEFNDGYRVEADRDLVPRHAMCELEAPELPRPSAARSKSRPRAA